MEKDIPHCKLSLVKALVRAGKVRATATAYNGACDLDIDNLSGMCEIVLRLTAIDFYKSMTTFADHRVWQDVYHAKAPGGQGVYLKLTVVEDVLIVSFKEL
jgi:motility quorum-sensing regulator / GCU-specific mRNA interferase toxin